MYELCIFDLDGTLADTLESMAYSANQILKELNLKEQPAQAFRYYAGEGVYELCKRVLAAAGDPKGHYYERFLEGYRFWFAKYCMYQVKPYAGIKELLLELKKRKVKTAVLSNKPHQQAIDVVHDLFGKDCFDLIQGQQEGIPRKPDPAGALHIAHLAGVRPDCCLYLGDTDTDMQTGNGAGMHTVGVLWGFRPREELEENHAQYLAATPMDILNILKDGQK